MRDNEELVKLLKLLKAIIENNEYIITNYNKLGVFTSYSDAESFINKKEGVNLGYKEVIRLIENESYYNDIKAIFMEDN